MEDYSKPEGEYEPEAVESGPAAGTAPAATPEVVEFITEIGDAGTAQAEATAAEPEPPASPEVPAPDEVEAAEPLTKEPVAPGELQETVPAETMTPVPVEGQVEPTPVQELEPVVTAGSVQNGAHGEPVTGEGAVSPSIVTAGLVTDYPAPDFLSGSEVAHSVRQPGFAEQLTLEQQEKSTRKKLYWAIAIILMVFIAGLISGAVLGYFV